jgi:myo-inositol-1(or 4)-monophosphatase
MDDLELAIAAARTGGAIVAAGFGRPGDALFKGRNDPVTEVDRQSELAITSLLAAHRPDDGILAEEGTATRERQRRWIVDPLDGTVNFIHGLPVVSVSVALWDGDLPVVGVVFDPINDELYAAATGGGATLNGEPIRVSEVADLGGALVITGFPYDHYEYADAYVRTLGEVLRRVNGIRRFGSAALDLCYVACGRVDASWEFQLKPWDIAAGLVILAEAGGTATDPFGAPMTPDRPHLVTSNGALHEELREIVASTYPSHLRDG